MSIVQWADTPRRSGQQQSERKNALTELENRKWTRTIVVWTNDVNDGPETLYASATGLPMPSGLPKIGDTYALGNDADLLATCVSVKIDSTESPFVWHYVAEYDTDRLVQAALNNPLNQPAEYQWNFSRYERATPRDALGITYQNTSGERFDPPITVEKSQPVVTITRNESSYSPALAAAYQDTCASDVIGGQPGYTWKMNTINGVKQIDIGLIYWRITYELELRYDTWARFVLDQGFRDINGKLWRDPRDSQPLGSPTLLNGRGLRQIDTTCLVATQQLAQDTTITVKAPTSGVHNGQDPLTFFPPGPTKGTPQWYYEIQIDNEIEQVVGGFGTDTWNVIRGYAGTTPATHLINATVQLMPYFLRFLPYTSVPFGPLNLGL